MPIRERNAWAGLAISAVALVTYAVLLLLRLDGQPVSDVAYQGLLLGIIGVAIVAMIVAHIVNSTLAGSPPGEPDEREREIERFAEHVGRAFVVLGGALAFLMALAEWDWFWIANTLYVGFALSAILEGIATIVAYRRGLPRW